MATWQLEKSLKKNREGKYLVDSGENKCAKLRSSRALVPYLSDVSYVTTCFKCLRPLSAYVPSCRCFLTCLTCLRFCTCLHLFTYLTHPHFFTCLTCLHIFACFYVHTFYLRAFAFLFFLYIPYLTSIYIINRYNKLF